MRNLHNQTRLAVLHIEQASHNLSLSKECNQNLPECNQNPPKPRAVGVRAAENRYPTSHPPNTPSCAPCVRELTLHQLSHRHPRPTTPPPPTHKHRATVQAPLCGPLAERGRVAIPCQTFRKMLNRGEGRFAARIGNKQAAHKQRKKQHRSTTQAVNHDRPSCTT